jgi:hypothetical protein
MITAALLYIVAGFVAFLGSLFPESDPSSAISSATNAVGTIVGFFSGFGVWLPLGTLGICALLWVSVYLVGFGIRLVRMLASFFTGGGGSAA